MSTKIKMALAAVVLLTTSSAVLAAPRHSTGGQAAISQAEQNWFDRASQPSSGGF